MTKKIKEVRYGLGGYDESKPNDNVVETLYYTAAELTEIDKADAKAAEKQAILDRLGLTADDLRALGL